MEFEGT